MKTLTPAEQEACKTVKGLFSTLSDKCKLQQNETILPLHYSKHVRHPDESAEKMDEVTED